MSILDSLDIETIDTFINFWTLFSEITYALIRYNFIIKKQKVLIKIG